MAHSKQERLREFFGRLKGLPPAASHDAARDQISTTLNSVEDAFSGVPFNPTAWRTDGRMYPFQDDSAADVPGEPGVTAYRSRRHETLIRTNGAYEIRDANTQDVVFSKAGADGRGVRQ